MPFLVAHGAVIAKLLVLGWFAAGVASERAVARRIRREEPQPEPAPEAHLRERRPVAWRHVRHHVRTVAIALVWAGFGYGAMRYAGGKICDHYREHNTPSARYAPATIPWPLQVAAAFPHSRSSALDTIMLRLENVSRQDASEHEMLLDLFEVALPCSSDAVMLTYYGEYDAAIARGRECSDRAGLVVALAATGRFVEAHDELRAQPALANELEPRTVEAIALASDDWQLAASAIERDRASTAGFEARYGTDPTLPDFANKYWAGQAQASTLHARCIGAWLRWHATHSTAELDALVPASERDDVCQLVHALARPPEQRADALADVARSLGSSTQLAVNLANELEWAYGRFSNDELRLAATKILRVELLPEKQAWLAPMARRNGVADLPTLAESVLLDELRDDRAAVARDLADAQTGSRPAKMWICRFPIRSRRR